MAKEARDALIRRLSERFPGYGLDRHAGYGTAQHRAALLASGPTSLHRHSFLKKILPPCSSANCSEVSSDHETRTQNQQQADDQLDL